MVNKTIVCRVPKELWEGIGKIEKEFRAKGFPITKPQIAVKIGNDLLNQKINIDIPVFRNNNRNMIDLGGFNGRIKVKKI